MAIGERIKNQSGAAWELANTVERWLAAIHQTLSTTLDEIRESAARDEFHRFTEKITVDANGDGFVIIQATQGWHYQLVNVAVTSGVGEDGALLTYMNGPDPHNLLHVTALGRFTSDAYPEGTFIPQGVNLYLRIISGNVSTDIPVNVLVKKLPTIEPLVTAGGGEA